MKINGVSLILDEYIGEGFSVSLYRQSASRAMVVVNADDSLHRVELCVRIVG